MKQIWCFGHGGHASVDGAIRVDTEFGPRDFCVNCQRRADQMPKYVAPEPQEVPSDHPAVQPKAAVKQTGSMSSWVRGNKDKGIDWLVAELPKAFPDSKPGLNPKLAKGYVNCYLKER